MLKLIIKLIAKCNNELNRLEKCLLLFMLWAALWPLVFPNWRTDGYRQVSDKDIEFDVQFVCSNRSTALNQMPDCPLTRPDYDQNFKVLTQIDHKLIESIAAEYDISRGGRHEPRECRSRQNVAIVVPYRNRSTHLSLFVQHMHRFLSRQSIEYTIFIVEQNDTKAFNRGKLFNIGFAEANRLDSFCCFIFHDIDVLPTNQNQLYHCSRQPRHMCSALDKFRYVLIYPDLAGGVIAISKPQYESVNGYSNVFEGWGGEDDDFSRRIRAKSLVLTRWSSRVSRCIMIKHKQETPNPNRMTLLREGITRYHSDGLYDLKESYELVEINFEPLFTLIKVKL